MRSIFGGIIILSVSMAGVDTAPAKQRFQGPPGYMQGYERPTDDGRKPVERHREESGLPASHDDITGAAPIHSEEDALTNRIGQDNAQLDRLIRSVCPTCGAMGATD